MKRRGMWIWKVQEEPHTNQVDMWNPASTQTNPTQKALQTEDNKVQDNKVQAN